MKSILEMQKFIFILVVFVWSTLTSYAQKDSTDLETITVGEAANIYSQLSSKIDLSVEQTLKYPGVFFDPARLAMAKAGVVNANDQANGLAIRGNSPSHLQWRLEGAIVLNPNHLSNAASYENYAAQNSGGVNMLSTQMLGTSSLVLSGFTSEYNNVLSGVMDMRLRNGRSDKRHYVAQIGLVGSDLSAEGALSKSKRWTYLANYRYSTVGLLNKMGVDFGGEKTAFQDLATTISYTSPNNWAAKVFLITGKSHNYFTHDSTNQEIMGYRKYTDTKFDQSNLITGFTLNGKLQNEDEWKITVAHSDNSFKIGVDAFTFKVNDTLTLNPNINPNIYPSNSIFFRYTKDLTTVFLQYKTQIYKNLFLRIGNNSSFYYLLNKKYRVNALELEKKHQTNFFTDIHWKINNRFQLVVGNMVDYIYSPDSSLHLREKSKINFWLPRVNVLFQISDNQLLTASYAKSRYNDYTTRFYNLKYQFKVRKIQGYVETYYQVLLSRFLSRSFYFVDAKQFNKGIVLGVSKNDNALYYDFNATLYDAKSRLNYTSNNFTKEQNAPFNGKFALNLTLGKEWKIKKQRCLGLNSHIFYNGGMPRSPQYKLNQIFPYPYDTLAFNNLRFPNYFRIDTRAYLSKQYKRFNSTFSIDIQNVTNNKVLTGENLDWAIDTYIPRYQVGIIPILTYRIEW